MGRYKVDNLKVTVPEDIFKNDYQDYMNNIAKNISQKKENVKPIDDGTKETMLNENLTHEQRLFCIYYSKLFKLY